MEAQQQFSVRAIPPPGLDRRFRAGRSWGKDAEIVSVVDVPKEANELSPVQLEAIKADRYFSVIPLGAVDADAHAMNAAKAKIVALETDLAAARSEIAGLVEENKALRLDAMKGAEEAGAKIARLEVEVADARGALASKRSRG